MTAEEWALAASAFFSGLGSGLFGMLCLILRPMQADMTGQEFQDFMQTFIWYGADQLPDAAPDRPDHPGRHRTL